jgi:hypothetical protein
VTGASVSRSACLSKMIWRTQLVALLTDKASIGALNLVRR